MALASIAAALQQALAVRDEAALDSCLSVQDDAVVATSVSKLSAGQAARLLEALVARLHRHPQQAARLVSWLRSLLLAHGAALAAAPAGQAALQLANQALQERTASYSALLALSGRLQVLEAAVGRSSDSSASFGTAAPKVIYTHTA